MTVIYTPHRPDRLVSADYAAEKRKSSPKAFNGMGDGAQTATIYHGTPMTPRAALNDVLAGRAACVSFYRPDDVEAVEAICPTVMYDNGAFSYWQQALRRGEEWAEDRDWEPFLSLAGAAAVHAGPVGDHPGYAGGTIPAQRQSAVGLALWALQGRADLAHGRPARTTTEALREIRSGLPGMDRAESRQPRLPFADGGSGEGLGQSLASAAHASWDSCCKPVSLRQCGQHQPRAERVAL